MMVFAALLLVKAATVAAVEYNDDFANGLDETYWKFVSNQALFQIDDSGGDILISKPEGGRGEGEDYGQICFRRDLLGDFDISFDMSNIQIDAVENSGDNTAAIALMFGGQYFYMGRNDEGPDGNGHVAGVWVDPPGIFPDNWYWTPQAETEGRFRVTRVGTRVVGTFNDTLIYDGHFNDGQVTRICLGTANNWSLDPLSVRIDNVSIIADSWSPAIEESKFAGSDIDEWDEFGNPMAISGDTLVITAQWANEVWRTDYRGTCGTVYVYERSDEARGGWEQVASISPDENADILRYGMGLAIDGDILAVGTHMACNEHSLYLRFCDAGVVHVYERSGSDPGTWERVAEFIAEGREDWYGFPLSLSGETLAVGAHWEGYGSGEPVPGAVHLYQRDIGGPGTWGEVAVLSASDGADEDWFGLALALSGDTIAIGAPAADVVCPSDPECNSGAVYVYERNYGGENAWGEVIKITPDDAEFDDRFGFDLALDGDTLLVANLTTDDRKGEAYFFERDHGGVDNWGLVKKVTPATRYSTKVTLRGDIALLSGNPTVVLGRDRGGRDRWGEVAALSPCDEGTIYENNGFGESGYLWDFHSPFAIDKHQFVVGAIGDDERGNRAGAAYVFTIDPCVLDRAHCAPRRSRGRVTPRPKESVTIASATLDDHAYELRKGVDFSWKDARNACAVEGKYLASIHSQEENDLLASLIEAADSQLDPARDHAAWIGLTDEDEEGVWLWVTGEPLIYENWRSGEPNNAHGGEHFAVMYTSYWGEFGYWNDVTHRDLFTLFFCETGDFVEDQKLTPNPKRIDRGAW